MEFDTYVQKLDRISNISEFQEFIDLIRPICSYEKSLRIIRLVEDAIQKSSNFEDNRILVSLYDLKIRQLYFVKDNQQEVAKLLSKMEILCKEVDYDAGLALVFHIKWYLNKREGNRNESIEFIREAIHIIQNSNKIDEYTYYFCSYSYAIENWLSYRDSTSIDLLEKCVNYFYENSYYHGLVMGLGTLLILYQQNQDKQKSMKLTKNIIRRSDLLDTMPKEVQSVIYFFVGFSQELSLNLIMAENYLLKSKQILRPIYNTSIYSSYYLTALSYLTSTYALQGKLELAWNQMIAIDSLIEEGIATKNLDNFNRNQMKHIFNLTKFYIFSRLQSVSMENLQKLTEEILRNVDKYYSNAIFFCEFLLNANLSKKQLIRIKKLNTPSTKRVEHILDFLIVKKKGINQKQTLELVSTLQRRPVEDRMTLEEKAFADLLAAQEYFKLKRYTEIYPLLRKYEKRLDQIEVLELRLFMEAFIQIGAYNNGDLMGPVNQYLAIKKCRLYRFTKLENRLLDYLDIQAKEARTNTNYIYS